MLQRNLDSSPRRTERTNVQRKRHQKGSLQIRKHGKRKMWVLLYRDGSSRKYATLGLHAKMSKSQAEAIRDELLNEVHARNAISVDRHITFGDFLEGVVLPYFRAKWKRSTAGTTENRIKHHLTTEFGGKKLSELSLNGMQQFLNRKAGSFSRSIVAHLRWDLSAIFKLAVAEGYAERDPTGSLYTPKLAVTAESRVMKKEEVEQYIAALHQRERVIVHLAIFSGMRPGEILGLQRRHISDDCKTVRVEQRLYRGDIDTPKTLTSARIVAIPSKTANQLSEWMGMVEGRPNSWVFASENPLKPMWRDNVWTRQMKTKLEAVGLGWANFQVLRRTHASLGHDAGIDPKVAADQRGHGIGVAIDTYTRSALSRRAEAAEQLEIAVLTA
jgi:integrase